jgi:hypothetical protein
LLVSNLPGGRSFAFIHLDLAVHPQFVDLAQILILANAQRPPSGGLPAPPRPTVSPATAEEHKQQEYYQDGFHMITTSLGWTGKQIAP